MVWNRNDRPLQRVLFRHRANSFHRCLRRTRPSRPTLLLATENLWVRFGLAGALLAAALAIPFHAVIVLRLRRAEGQWGMLTLTQVLAAAIFTPAMMFSLMALAAAAFRAGQRDPQITQAFSDFFWLWFIGIVGTIVMQNLTLAIASFTDKGDPRHSRAGTASSICGWRCCRFRAASWWP